VFLFENEKEKMMKNLLVLILVLGVTTVATAGLGLELSVNGVYDGTGNVTAVELPVCQTLVIDVAAPAGLDWGGYIAIMGAYPGAGGEWGDKLSPVLPLCSGYYYEDQAYPIIHTEVGGGAGDLSNANRYEYEGWGFGYELGDNQSLGQNPGGTAFEFLYHCCGPQSEYVTINLFDASGEAVEDTIIVHQIPEPMTIALLGLGGLLLRRRK
jgi:hypothetical protein